MTTLSGSDELRDSSLYVERENHRNRIPSSILDPSFVAGGGFSRRAGGMRLAVSRDADVCRDPRVTPQLTGPKIRASGIGTRRNPNTDLEGCGRTGDEKSGRSRQLNEYMRSDLSALRKTKSRTGRDATRFRDLRKLTLRLSSNALGSFAAKEEVLKRHPASRVQDQIPRRLLHERSWRESRCVVQRPSSFHHHLPGSRTRALAVALGAFHGEIDKFSLPSDYEDTLLPHCSGIMEKPTIVVLGRSDAGKTTFIKAVQNAAGIREALAGEEEPTLSILEYDVPLSDGQSLTFVDTPGFDGYRPGGEPAKKTEEILQMLEEHLGANGSRPVSHVLVFFNANSMDPTDFKPRAQRAFERLFPNAQVASITTRWDQIEDDDGPPATAEEAQSKEESLYANGRTGESLLDYLLGGDVLRFRSGLPNEAYSFPQDIVHKLFPGPGSDTTLEERLAAVTKERDDLAAKYALLLQEKQAWTAARDCAPGPPDSEPVRPCPS
ncbi:hypothetical protein DFP72DRAFT_1045555, partial [Ephemerocybe angulata]